MTPFLVTLPGLRGPVHQVWYRHGKGFVGCAEQKPIEKVELPEGEWNINRALAYTRAQRLQ